MLLPGVVLIVVPGIILYSSGTINFAWGLEPPLNALLLTLGAACIALGLFLMAKTISLFAGVGQGTLAPWEPPKKLVVKGIYRHVRNPMISGVLFILCGETLCFSSTAILAWFLFFLLANLIYIPILEEPGLEKRFGEDYTLYKKNVPRWIPRPHPWEQPAA
jgi:protein-S-isoprenylcysteine O-methyltransferase Ste14